MSKRIDIKRLEDSLNYILECGCEHLPEDWQLHVVSGDGFAGLELIDPEGEEVQFDDIERSVGEMFMDRLTHARREDGLSAPEFEGEAYEPAYPQEQS